MVLRTALLPHSLCALVFAHLSPALAQSTTSTTLPLNVPVSLPTNNSSSPTSSPILFALPPSSSISVSVALCASASSSNLQFWVTNSSAVALPGPGDGGGGDGSDVFQIALDAEGIGNWTGVVSSANSGKLAVYGLAPTDSVQVGVSDEGPLFAHLPLEPKTLPHFGDTTSNQALLYSAPFSPISLSDPSYPNYTLPPAIEPFGSPSSSLASPPSGSPNYTLILAPTGTGVDLTTLPQTACALSRAAIDPRTNGTIAATRPWLRDPKGFRTEWLVNGLSPETNYTAYAIKDGVKLSGPIFFSTKSGAFACPLVYDLPYCPSTSYAVPLPQPPSGDDAYTGSNLPSSISGPLLSALANFTTSLTSFACGRDLYSPLQTCASCQRAYQKWLCATSFPRCAEPPSVNASSFVLPPAVAAQDTLAQAAFLATAVPTAALSAVAAGATPRNEQLPVFNSSYNVLLPCLETCNAADRACPSFIGFKCPVARFNANESYGVGFIDGGFDISHVPGAGNPGVAQDRWGNVWCSES